MIIMEKLELNEENTALVKTYEDLLKLKSRQNIRYYCVKCGKLTYYRGFRPWRAKYLSEFKCGPCRSKEFNLNKYGVEFYTQTDDFKNKSKITVDNKTPEEKAMATTHRQNAWKNKSLEEMKARLDKSKAVCMMRYGVDNPMKNEAIKNKCIETNNNKTEEEKEAIRTRTAKTLASKYGTGINSVGDLLKNSEIRHKARETRFERYGNYNNAEKMVETKKNWTPEKRQLMLNKLRTSMLEKYGYEIPTQCPAIKQKIKEIWTSKSPEEIKARSDKIKATLLNRTGLSHPIVGKINYYGLIFDSTWELAVWIYCIDHSITITKVTIGFDYYDMCGKSYKYFPDLMINGKLVEIKSDHFFRPDGTMYYPYLRLHRDSEDFTPEEKAYYDDLYERKHQCGLANGVEFWRGSDCKLYIEYCNMMYPGWSKRFRKDNPFNPSYWCFNISNPGYYQPQYYVPIQDKGAATPYDIPDSDGFVVKGRGITPYDIPRQ